MFTYCYNSYIMKSTQDCLRGAWRWGGIGYYYKTSKVTWGQSYSSRPSWFLHSIRWFQPCFSCSHWLIWTVSLFVWISKITVLQETCQRIWPHIFYNLQLISNWVLFYFFFSFFFQLLSKLHKVTLPEDYILKDT